MQFIDLAAQQQRIRDKVDANIKAVLDSGKYINGPQVKELEEKLAAYAGTKFALGCSSGTDALLIPLMAYGVGPGDAVFTSPFTFIASAEVIQLLGATPVFADIDPVTYNIDPQKLDAAIAAVKATGTLTPKVIIPVDIFGQTADYDAINAVAEKFGIPVLEDAAQSFGASYKGKKSCSLADVAATSFFPAKPLGCYGDGGMVFTDNEDLYKTMVSIRVHGQGSDKYDNVRVGINGRLDTLQAAVLLAKMEIFDEEISLRQTVAGRYEAGLKDAVTTPQVAADMVSAWAQYSIQADDREAKIVALKEAGVPTAVYYPKPLHLQTAFKELGHAVGDFPVSEQVAGRIFSVPFYPYLSESDQEQIIKAIK